MRQLRALENMLDLVTEVRQKQKEREREKKATQSFVLKIEHSIRQDIRV